MDVNRPAQVTPVPNFFLAGSYTFQDYIDSMEGATKSGMLCADAILARTDMLQQYKTGAKAVAAPAAVKEDAMAAP